MENAAFSENCAIAALCLFDLKEVCEHSSDSALRIALAIVFIALDSQLSTSPQGRRGACSALAA